MTIKINSADENLIFNFYLSKLSNDWLLLIHQLCVGIEQKLGFKYNEAIVYYDKTNKPLKKILSKNIQDLFSKIDQNGTENLSSIYFDLNEKKYKYTMAELNYVSKQDTYKPYYHIFILIRLDVFKYAGKNFKELFVHILSKIKQIGIIEYAFLHTMHSEKMPLGYFCGFGSDKMTSDENIKLQIWKQNKQRYNKLVWDVFLENIINRNILNENIVNDIETIVGSNNLIKYDDLIVFSLPVELEEWIKQDEKTLKIRNALIDLFRANNLLMKKIIKPETPAVSVAKKKESPIIEEDDKTINYKGPNYVEQYLRKGSKKIIEKIEEEYCMVASGIARKTNKQFNLLIDENEKYVTANDSEGTILLYDPSQHPANMAFEQELKPDLKEYKCEKCGSNIFEVVVGYEYPADAEDQNDISSFALAGKCTKCKSIKIIFEDETA